MPAQLTTTDGRPRSAAAFAPRRAPPPDSRRRRRTRGAVAQSRAVLSAASSATSRHATRAPSADRRRAVAAPRPEPAPVTIAVWSVKRFSDMGATPNHAGSPCATSLTIEGVTPMAFRVSVRRWWVRGAALEALSTLAACASTGGGGRPRPTAQDRRHGDRRRLRDLARGARCAPSPAWSATSGAARATRWRRD
jgi:hypothetical protein